MGTVNVHMRLSTEAAAEAFRDDYLRRWPTAGYGTILTVHRVPDGAWAVSGSRQSSCD